MVRAARRSSPADGALLNDAVRDAIMLQEEIGLDVITDGEVRRVSWAQTPRFVDAFATSDRGRRRAAEQASATDSGALNWRGGGRGCSDPVGRPPARVPGGGPPHRDREADSGT